MNSTNDVRYLTNAENGTIPERKRRNKQMHELPRTIPDVRMLLTLTPEELAVTILFLLKKRNDTKFHPGNLQNELWGHFTSGQPQYPQQYANEINQALAEAWAWLQTQGLLVADMENGQHGWRHLSRRARAM
jgi:hypothetical protein